MSRTWVGGSPRRGAFVALAALLALGAAAGCGPRPTAGARPATPSATATTSTPDATETPTATDAPTIPAATPSRTASRPVRTTGKATTGPPRKPASYDPKRDITDLVPTTTGLRLARPVNGVRHGEVTLTIRNNGPKPVWHVAFVLEVPESMSADGGDWSGCTRLGANQAEYPAFSKCDKGYLASGESRTYHLRMQSPAAKDGADSLISRWLVDVWSGGTHGEHYPDRAGDDNRRIFSVFRA